ncbi:hypothetical protein FHW83_001979 [Duganella sp. SG902]|uniref:T6SS immunity protein Tli4 family protein n=1 Tax=Duganella sp. SG902 TaxID=2587016 RepID=UPI00159EB2BC|nr:T6SS immunity protein Tli4 family protein [Duganella sp. SG902]NVM76184.1 hypothetical protein [Duganella sp. SG902]
MDEKIAEMRMRSVCVGRFIVDVPKKAEVSFRPAVVAGWKISTVQETDEDFKYRIQQKEAFLATSKNERNGVSLELVREVKNTEVAGRIFLFDRRWIGLMRGGREVISESVSIDAMVRSNGISFDFTSKLRDPERLGFLEKIVQQLRGVTEEEIPSEAGFCFDHGLILDPLTVESHESVSIFGGTEEKPDVAISLATSAGLNIQRTLLQRHENSLVQSDHPSNFHDFHVGPRTINGVAGEEVLQRIQEENGTRAHGFMWESLASKHDVYLPSLVLELDTGLGRPGEPVNSSLSDAEVLALWGQISSSLRRRPVQ